MLAVHGCGSTDWLRACRVMLKDNLQGFAADAKSGGAEVLPGAVAGGYKGTPGEGS
jgi:hypothetical protein